MLLHEKLGEKRQNTCSLAREILGDQTPQWFPINSAISKAAVPWHRQSQGPMPVHIFKDGDLENEVTLKVRSRSPKSYLHFVTIIQYIKFS